MCFDGHLESVEKVARRRWLDSNNRAVQARSLGMGAAVQLWLDKFARQQLKIINARLKSGGVKGLERSAIAKVKISDFNNLETELFALLRRFGLANMQEGGDAASKTVGEGKWKMKPQIVADMNERLANKVVLLVKETEAQVRRSVKQMVTDALLESPTPTSRTLARRIARQWMGPPSDRVPVRDAESRDLDGDLQGRVKPGPSTADWRRTQEQLDAGGREGIFSFSRANTIARTELAQARNAGISEGFKESGVKMIRWLAYPNDGKSAGRMHYRMNRHKPISVKDLAGDDSGKWFKLPSGWRTPYPNWIGLPAGETVNCRCNLIPS